jgi:hypothetical protein
MKQKQRTFFEILKRFLEPIKLRPKMYIKYFFVAFWWGINGVFHVLFLERITFYLQKSDKI